LRPFWFILSVMAPRNENDPGKGGKDSLSSDEEVLRGDGNPRILASTDEEEDGENHLPPGGYQPLSQEPAENVEDYEGDEEEEQLDAAALARLATAAAEPSESVVRLAAEARQNRARMEAEESAEIFSKSASSSNAIEMNDEKSAAIKAAMSNFTLPAPAWARDLKEEEWREAVRVKLDQNQGQ